MNIIVLGAAGFIGTNLAINLVKNENDKITVVDASEDYFVNINKFKFPNIIIEEACLDINTDFEKLFKEQDVVYHLVSTTVPTTSNQHIVQELTSNVIVTAKMLDACVKCGVKKIVFISSGGTVYGKDEICPLKEDNETNPITSYGLQKVTIEKLLYLYKYMYGLDYRIIRLANPYGPYQKPNGILGAVTTFTYKALKGETIEVYGDGTVIRDFIYIDDAIRGILTITNGENEHNIFNLGSGYGTSINEVLDIIKNTLSIKMNIIHKDARKVDVPINYLDISRYEEAYGKLNPITLSEGVKKTSDFIKENYF